MINVIKSFRILRYCQKNRLVVNCLLEKDYFLSQTNSKQQTLREVHDVAGQESAAVKDSPPLTQLQSELEKLQQTRKISSKQEIVIFLDKAKRLLMTSESFLTKQQLLGLLDRVSQLRDTLGTQQIQNWSGSFWKAMSHQLAMISRSYSIKDISNILDVYAVAFSDSSDNKNTISSDVSEINEKLFGELMKILDLRMRQIEGKDFLVLGEGEFQHILSIIKSASFLHSCKIAPPLLQRLLLRVCSKSEFWGEDHILETLTCLNRLRYIDKHAQFCVFVLNVLAKKTSIDQHKLCNIIYGMSLIKPKYVSNDKLNYILHNVGFVMNDLTTDELEILASGLAKMKFDVDENIYLEIMDEFCWRVPDCTPSQISSAIFNITALPKTSIKNEICIAAVHELTIRTTFFKPPDLAKIIFGLCQLRFHPQNTCLSKVMSHSLDILLGDEILQDANKINNVESYDEIEHCKKMKGIEAKAELDDLEKPHHFTNRAKTKHLKGVIAQDHNPEDPIYQKQKYKNFTGSELALLIFGLAQMGIEELGDKFFDFVKEEIVRDVISFDVYELTFALWGLAISGHLDKRCILFALGKMKDDDLKNDEQIKSRIGKCLITLAALKPSDEKLDTKENTYLHDCYQLWLRKETNLALTSPVIREAVYLLKKIGLKCKLRHQMNSGLCVGDILEQVNGQTFALEVRPLSFANIKYQIPGESKWRLQLLEAAGCTVLYIDSIAWGDNSESQNIEYLKRLTGLL